MFVAKILLNYLFAKEIAVIVDLFKHKNIHTGVLSLCCDDKSALLIHKTFIINKLMISGKKVDPNQNVRMPVIHRNVGIVVNASCEGWENILSFYNHAFKSPFVWFIITKNLSETTDVLSQYKIELDSDVTIVLEHGNMSILYEIYNTGFYINGQLIIRELGFWNGSLQVETTCRRDLKGLVLRSVVAIPTTMKVVHKTFVRFMEEEKPDLVKVDAVHEFKYFAAMLYLRDMLNVTYEYLRTTSWGYQLNGTFDGIVGMLQRGEADIGGSPIYIRTNRSKVVDFASETWLTKLSFIFRHPKHPGGYFTIYTRPLDNEVWGCIGALMAISITLLGFLLKLNVIMAPGDDEDASLSLALLFVWSTICQQGMSISRNSAAVKVIVFVSFIFSLTLYQYYNATVVSTLLREPPKNIRTLSDLLKSNLKVGIDDNLYNKDYFKHTTDPVAKELYTKKIAHTAPYNFFSAKEGIAMVKKGGFAFNIETTVAFRLMRLTFTDKELCELQEVKMNAPQITSVSVQKRSPYKDVVAYSMRRMKEAGIHTRLQSFWDEGRPDCIRNPDSSIFSVSIHEFSTPLIVLTLGYMVATMVLSVELFVWKLDTKKMIEFKQ